MSSGATVTELGTAEVSPTASQRWFAVAAPAHGDRVYTAGVSKVGVASTDSRNVHGRTG